MELFKRPGEPDKPSLPSSDQADAVLWNEGEWVHLPYALLEAYVDEKLDAVDREIAATHLEDCPACAHMEADLRALREELEAAREAQRQQSTRRMPGPLWRLLVPTASLSAAGGAFVWWLMAPSLRATRIPPVNPSPRTALPLAPVASQPKETDTGLQVKLAAAERENRRLREQLEQVRLRARSVPRIQVAQATPELLELSVPDLSMLKTRIPVYRDAPTKTLSAPFRVRFPTATRLTGDRPTFRWEPVPQARGYTVLVVDEEDHPVAGTAEPVLETRWTPTAPLPRGKTLGWEVRALVAEEADLPVTPEARFHILETRAAGRLARELAAAGKDKLRRARALAKVGAVAEAEAELEGEVSPLARHWRKRLRALQAPIR